MTEVNIADKQNNSIECLSLILRNAPKKVIDDAIRERALDLLAESMGIQSSQTDLQEEADNFRIANGLLSHSETTAWLTERGLTGKNWCAQLDTRVRERKLLSSSHVEEQVELNFKASPGDYDKALISRIVVEDEGIAMEIYKLVTDEAYNFGVLARRYTIEPFEGSVESPATRYQVFRFQLLATFANDVFSGTIAKPQVLQPIKVKRLWHLYKVFGICAAEFDNGTRLAIRQRILDAMLKPFIVIARQTFLSASYMLE